MLVGWFVGNLCMYPLVGLIPKMFLNAEVLRNCIWGPGLEMQLENEKLITDKKVNEKTEIVTMILYVAIDIHFMDSNF